MYRIGTAWTEQKPGFRQALAPQLDQIEKADFWPTPLAQQEPVDLAGRLQPPHPQGMAGRPELKGQEGKWLQAAHLLPPPTGQQRSARVVAIALVVPALVQSKKRTPHRDFVRVVLGCSFFISIKGV